MTKKRLLPTSTVGSLPKPAWLAPSEKLWSPWKLEGDGLIEGKQDALLISLQEQQLAGLDIICDGEQTRQHFVTTFIEHLSGVDFENRKIVKIRDRYEASVPVVVNEVARCAGCTPAMIRRWMRTSGRLSAMTSARASGTSGRGFRASVRRSG